jgi:hypothetical protein
MSTGVDCARRVRAQLAVPPPLWTADGTHIRGIAIGDDPDSRAMDSRRVTARGLNFYLWRGSPSRQRLSIEAHPRESTEFSKRVAERTQDGIELLGFFPERGVAGGWQDAHLGVWHCRGVLLDDRWLDNGVLSAMQNDDGLANS